jgi:hypothetical protein
MKKISLFIITIFFGAATAFASGKNAMNIIPLTADRVLVAMEQEKPAPVEVRVTDEDGRLVFYKSVRRSNGDYRKIYDLSALENGRYDVVFSIDNAQTKRTIELKDDKVVVGELRYSYDPTFIFDNDNLKFSYLNFDKEDFMLKLYLNGQMVYESKVGNDFALTRGFNLSRLGNGSYDVVLASGSKEFYHTVSID